MTSRADHTRQSGEDMTWFQQIKSLEVYRLKHPLKTASCGGRLGTGFITAAWSEQYAIRGSMTVYTARRGEAYTTDLLPNLLSNKVPVLFSAITRLRICEYCAKES